MDDVVTRNVEATPVYGEDGSVRGWVRLDADRVGHDNQTQFCITVDTSSFLSPDEARAFAKTLSQVADDAEVRLALGGTR